uniref:Uncharacterized protein n=1 Tax=Heterosigma akashiwo TaxID=2829 RepID=A0A7S3XNZ3_HETAK
MRRRNTAAAPAGGPRRRCCRRGRGLRRKHVLDEEGVAAAQGGPAQPQGVSKVPVLRARGGGAVAGGRVQRQRGLVQVVHVQPEPAPAPRAPRPGLRRRQQEGPHPLPSAIPMYSNFSDVGSGVSFIRRNSHGAFSKLMDGAFKRPDDSPTVP